MGRSLARVLASEGCAVVLLARDASDAEKSAEDLRQRGSPRVAVVGCDLDAPADFDAALSRASDALGGLDGVILTAADFATQEALEADAARLEQLLHRNVVGSILFCEAARKRLMARGGGHLVAFSSVAGDRGRKPIVLYGATKAALSAYLEGLDHRYRAAGLITLCVKPGFVRTAMTAGLKEPPFAADPEEVAAAVVEAMRRQDALVYAPGIWRLVMLVIRHLPRFVMRRVGF